MNKWDYTGIMLIGEIVITFRRCIKVVNGWKGPTRTYHDFQYKNKSIEVKSTRKKKPKLQLVVKNNDKMKLKIYFSMHILLFRTGEDTLLKIIQRIEKLLEGTYSLRIFSRLLNIYCERTRFDSYDTTYGEHKQYWFDVKDGFQQ